MSTGRLATQIWIGACQRLAEAEGRYVTLLQRGDAVQGTVVLLTRAWGGGQRLSSLGRRGDGRLTWIAAEGGRDLSEAEVQASLERIRRRDPDAWILEVEGRDHAHPFDPDLLEQV